MTRSRLVVAALAGLVLIVAPVIRWLVLPIVLGPFWRLSEAPACQVFRGGIVLTMDAQGSVAEAVGVRKGRIAAVGSAEDVERTMACSGEVEDLAGGALLPGFIEAHGHFPGAGLDAVAADLSAPPVGEVTTIAALIERMRRAMKRKSARGWVLGYGYDDTLLAERRHPTRDDLDRVSRERPLFVLHVSGHMGVANSAALAELGIGPKTPSPAGGEIVRDPTSGRATGLLREAAVYPARQRALDFSVFEQLSILRRATDLYARAGVTTVENGLATIDQIRGIARAVAFDVLPLRVVVWPSVEAYDALKRGELKLREGPRLILGATKLVADGSIQGYTAYLSQPYYVQPSSVFAKREPWRGYPTIDRRTLERWITRLYGEGRQVAVHANGDAAIDMVLDAVESARERFPVRDARTILVHAQMIRSDQISRAAALDVTPSFFVAHTWYWGDRHRDVFLGPVRAARISPLASADAAGLRYAIHLDTPVVPIDPLLLAWTAVERRTRSGRVLGASERIGVERALRAVTIDAAWQLRLEDRIGSIEVGKFADFVLLDADPRGDPATLRRRRVLATWVGGRRVLDLRNAGKGKDGDRGGVDGASATAAGSMGWE